MMRHSPLHSDSDDTSDEETNFKRRQGKRSHKSISCVDDVDASVSTESSKKLHVDLEGFSDNAQQHRSNGVMQAPDAFPSSVKSSSDDASENGSISSGVKDEVITENGVANIFNFPITHLSSATEIMKHLGFNSSRGFGKLMDKNEISAAKLEKINDVLREAGISVDGVSVDFTEEISVEEEINWMTPVFPDHPCDSQFLTTWRSIGPVKTMMHGETSFIDEHVLKDLIVLKKCFNALTETEYQMVRSRCNPFESIGKGPFICRAGTKMANLDAVLSFVLTQPTTNSADKHPVIGPSDLFYFADVCAGPGGFTEYVLFRKKWSGKGFGMTLKGKLDFEISSSRVASPESFEPFYGPENDGNVYNPNNTSAFINHVMASTDGHGVHLMMADGGFTVKNKELQEICSAQIYLAQCYIALSIIRQGGMFICKFFDTLTPFTVGLIYLMYMSFDLVAIHKPNTSRPANSERYLICKWKKQDVSGICSYLLSCHSMFWRWTCQEGSGRKEDILELVPLSVLQGSKNFYEYILGSNNCIARLQIENLKRMVVLCSDLNLDDPRKEAVKAKCLEYWKIPDASPDKTIPNVKADTCFKEILGAYSREFIERQEYPLTEHNVEAYIRSPFDWRIVVVEASFQSKSRGFYMALSNGRMVRYCGQEWVTILESLKLCRNTLVYGEFVDEIHGTKPAQRVVKTFHIIDAMVLGGKDVRALHYTTRHEVCVKFAKSMNQPSRRDLCAVRAKNPVRMENIADVFDRLENRIVVGKGAGTHLVCPVDHTDETLPFIKPAGILFLKITKDPWTMALSRSSNRKYYFNLSTGTSSFVIPEDSISDFDYTMQHRMVWLWDEELKTKLAAQDVADETQAITTGPGVLNPQSLLHYIKNSWNANRSEVMRRLSSSSSQGSS